MSASDHDEDPIGTVGVDGLLDPGEHFSIAEPVVVRLASTGILIRDRRHLLLVRPVLQGQPNGGVRRP